MKQLLDLYRESVAKGEDIRDDIFALFDEPLNPVSARGQRKVNIVS
jgi:hypothetical protein